MIHDPSSRGHRECPGLVALGPEGEGREPGGAVKSRVDLGLPARLASSQRIAERHRAAWPPQQNAGVGAARKSSSMICTVAVSPSRSSRASAGKISSPRARSIERKAPEL